MNGGSVFLKMVKPLERYEEIKFWSDRDIETGKNWKKEIDAAMRSASVAVLLVSYNFLASDFIANEELPFFLDAARDHKVGVMWVLITPCLWKNTRLKNIQALCVNEFEPLVRMTGFGWMQTLCALGEKIDEVVRNLETPVINLALNGRKLQRVQLNLQVLAAPARRETEVLVLSGDKRWHVQSRISKGSMRANCWIGDEEHSKSGDKFQIVAITRARLKLIPGSVHMNLPQHRTRSKEITVIRA